MTLLQWKKQKKVSDNIELNNIYDTVVDADAIFHITEWKEFRMPNWKKIKSLMNTPLLIDGRNVFDKDALEGFTYLKIG